VLRFIPISSRNSLPVSAVERNASANIAELPVNTAATYLQTAIARLAMIATTTTFLADRRGISLGRAVPLYGCNQLETHLLGLQPYKKATPMRTGFLSRNLQNLP